MSPGTISTGAKASSSTRASAAFAGLVIGDKKIARETLRRHDRRCRAALPPLRIPQMVADRPVALASDRTSAAFLALLGGAVAMGISPVFVRFAEIGPFASAFWRVALALPVLWLWARMEGPSGIAPSRAERIAVLAAGLLFAGDLTFWHLSILHTTVANATFLAVLAPVWVVLGSGLFLGESVGRGVLVGLALCIAGAAALIGGTLSANPAQLDGDLYGLATSFFFGAYFLAVRLARRAYGSGRILFLSTAITAALPRDPGADRRGQAVAGIVRRRRRARRAGAGQPCRRPGAARLRARAPSGGVLLAGHLPGGRRRGRLRLAHPRREPRRDAVSRRGGDPRRHRGSPAEARMSAARAFCRAMFDAAVARAQPAICLPPYLPGPPRGRLIVLACGKAGALMAEAVERHYLDGGLLPPARLEGVCVTRHGHGRPLRRIRCIEAGHPVPDDASVSGTEATLALAATAAARRSCARPHLRRRIGELDRAPPAAGSHRQAGADPGAPSLRRADRRHQHRPKASVAHQGRQARRTAPRVTHSVAGHVGRARRRPVHHRLGPDRAGRDARRPTRARCCGAGRSSRRRTSMPSCPTR